MKKARFFSPMPSHRGSALWVEWGMELREHNPMSLALPKAMARRLIWQEIAIVSFAVTCYFKKLNTAFVILGGAFLGYVLFLMSEFR